MFDVYRPSSLNAEARSKRGHGARRRVTSRCKVPPNWRNFLRDNDNKTDLFNLLADKIEQMPSPNMVIVTKEENALSNHTIRLEGMSPCSHDEADTRIIVHARHAAQEGCKSLLVKASDTDILDIAISVMPTLQAIGLQQLWIAFVQGMNMRWIPAHELYRSIVHEKGRGITFFHAFTGCDVVSAFSGKGKKSAWQTWDMCAEAYDVFARLSQYPPTVNDNEMDILEKIVVIIYDMSSTATGVNNARLDMFARKQRPYQAIPPTRSALLQHVNRAAYQAGCVWSQSTLRQPETQGWAKNGDMGSVVWTTLPPIVESYQQVTKCGCKYGRCKYYRLGLSCTALCSCRCES